MRSIARAEYFQAVSDERKEKIAAALGVKTEDLWSEVRVGSIIAGPDGAYRVSAVASDGSFVIAPVEFGENELVSPAELKARFGVSSRGPLNARGTVLRCWRKCRGRMRTESPPHRSTRKRPGEGQRRRGPRVGATD